MICEDLQFEEKDVLNSIYDGDERFKVVDDATFQYKVGDIDGGKSFVIEFVWGMNYPNEKPIVNLNAFYNNHIAKEVKTEIINQVLEEAKQNEGCAMTYTLIEWVKENFENLIAKQPDKASIVEKYIPSYTENSDQNIQVQIKKKTQLSKSQKRRVYDRGGADAVKGEIPRGFDWVDVVKHLSQTSSQSSGLHSNLQLTSAS